MNRTLWVGALLSLATAASALALSSSAFNQIRDRALAGSDTPTMNAFVLLVGNHVLDYDTSFGPGLTQPEVQQLQFAVQNANRPELTQAFELLRTKGVFAVTVTPPPAPADPLEGLSPEQRTALTQATQTLDSLESTKRVYDTNHRQNRVTNFLNFGRNPWETAKLNEISQLRSRAQGLLAGLPRMHPAVAAAWTRLNAL